MRALPLHGQPVEHVRAFHSGLDAIAICAEHSVLGLLPGLVGPVGGERVLASQPGAVLYLEWQKHEIPKSE
jgi:hypothetical protein